MKLEGIPFIVTDWSTVERTEHPGERGTAWWKTRHFGEVRVRFVEYSAGYLADHWCKKGHVVLVVSGELETELEDGRVMTLAAGSSYQVADGEPAHRSSTAFGATLFIVD